MCRWSTSHTCVRQRAHPQQRPTPSCVAAPRSQYDDALRVGSASATDPLYMDTSLWPTGTTPRGCLVITAKEGHDADLLVVPEAGTCPPPSPTAVAGVAVLYLTSRLVCAAASGHGSRDMWFKSLMLAIARDWNGMLQTMREQYRRASGSTVRLLLQHMHTSATCSDSAHTACHRPIHAPRPATQAMELMQRIAMLVAEFNAVACLSAQVIFGRQHCTPLAAAQRRS